MSERYTVISSDCHAGAAIDTYKDYLEARWHEEFDEWRAAYSNPFRDLQKTNTKRTRNWDNEQRLSEQDGQGVVAEVVFPNTVPPFFPSSSLVSRPADGRRLRAAPGRGSAPTTAGWRSGAPSTPSAGPESARSSSTTSTAALEDIRFIAENGLRGGVLIPGVSEDTGLPGLHHSTYEPIWQMCADLDVVLNHHTGSASPDYGDEAPGGVIWIIEQGWFAHRALTHLIMAGVFERHPSLKLVLTEQGAGWVPDTLRMLDMMAMGVRSGKMGELGFDPDQAIPRQPSEYWGRELLRRLPDRPDDPRGAHCDRARQDHVGQRLPPRRGLLPQHPGGVAAGVPRHRPGHRASDPVGERGRRLRLRPRCPRPARRRTRPRPWRTWRPAPAA